MFYTSILIFFVNSYAHNFEDHFEKDLIKLLKKANYHSFEDLQKLTTENEIDNIRRLSDRYKNQIKTTMSTLGLSFNGIPEDALNFKETFSTPIYNALKRNQITCFQDLQNLGSEENLRNLKSIGDTKADKIIAVMSSLGISFNSGSSEESSEETVESSTSEAAPKGFFFFWWSE